MEHGRKGRWVVAGLILPVTLCVVYGVTLWLLPRDRMKWFNSELGPVELGTAMIFLAIAVTAARLVVRLPRAVPPVPGVYRLWFALFLLGGTFMFLEETSYGQAYFQWESPQWFQEHNKQDETNLHNLWGDTPSSLLRSVANIGLPMLAIMLPLVFTRHRQGYQPGHFSYYLFPRWEMTAWIVLAALSSPVRKVFGLGGSGTIWHGSVSEFKEMLWAGGLLVYLATMHHRLLGPASPSTPHSRVAARPAAAPTQGD